MKIAYVNRWNYERCGVALYGKLHAQALRARGHEVLELDPFVGGDWTALSADIIHVGFHGGLYPHIRRAMFPPKIPFSVYLHESFASGNRASTPCWDEADLIVVPSPALPEGGKDPLVIEMPCPDVDPQTLAPPPVGPLVVGYGGIRKEGVESLLQISAEMGLSLDLPFEEWLSVEEEISRLSSCHLNVFWYNNAYGGQSMAIMFAVAARRPILASRARQFSSLFEWGDEIYFVDDLKRGLCRVLEDLKRGKEKRPLNLPLERSWSRAAGKWESAWEGLLSSRP